MVTVGIGQLGLGGGVGSSAGAATVIVCSPATFKGWLCDKVSLHPGWTFTLLEFWILLG